MCNQPNCRRLWGVFVEQTVTCTKVCVCLDSEFQPLKIVLLWHLINYRNLACFLELVLCDAIEELFKLRFKMLKK